MKQSLNYLKLQLKQAKAAFPRSIAASSLLLVLIGSIAILGIHFLYQGKLVDQIRIAVVADETNPMTKLLLSYVSNMESTEALCVFENVEESRGLEGIKQGTYAACMILPETVVEDILNGTNTPVRVVLPENGGIGTILLQELTDAGADMLSVAQAEIYATYDLVVDTRMYDRLAELEAKVDKQNLDMALNRTGVFQQEQLSAVGKLAIWQYYLAAGILLSLLLWGISCSFIQDEPTVMQDLLKRQGCPDLIQLLCKLNAVFVMYLGYAIVLFALLRIIGTYIGIEMFIEKWDILIFMLMLLLMATWTLALSYLAGKDGAQFFLFPVAAFGVMGISGGFAPMAFLPDKMRTIGELLPVHKLIAWLGGSIRQTGSYYYQSPEMYQSLSWSLFGWSLFLMLAAFLMMKHKRILR
ncbi:MAG: ABC transporter permease [Lachnospiraceae bacterium]|nr:ABC transporter permease [Lachnospiraceae bacterium]